MKKPRSKENQKRKMDVKKKRCGRSYRLRTTDMGQTSDPARTSHTPTPEPKLRTSEALRTTDAQMSDPDRTSDRRPPNRIYGRPTGTGRPDPREPPDDW